MTFCYQSRHAHLSPATLNHCFTQLEPLCFCLHGRTHTHTTAHTHKIEAHFGLRQEQSGAVDLFSLSLTPPLLKSSASKVHKICIDFFLFFFCLRQFFRSTRPTFFSGLQDPLNLLPLCALFGKDWIIYDLERFRAPNEASWIVRVRVYVWFTGSMCVPVSCVPDERKVQAGISLHCLTDTLQGEEEQNRDETSHI